MPQTFILIEDLTGHVVILPFTDTTRVMYRDEGDYLVQQAHHTTKAKNVIITSDLDTINNNLQP